MSSFDNLKYSLETTGIYNVTEGTPLFAELMAYASAIDEVVDAAEILKREAFVTDAQDYGLTRIEKLYGKEMSDLDTSDRRSIILNRLCVTPKDHTAKSFSKILTSCSMTHFNIYEQKGLELLTITGNGHTYSDAQIAWILSQLERLMPAHLQINIFLNEINWQRLDARGLSWDELDSQDLTWDEFDNLREEE